MTRKKKPKEVIIGKANLEYPWTKKEREKIERYHGYTWLYCDLSTSPFEILEKGYFEEANFDCFARPEHLMKDLGINAESAENCINIWGIEEDRNIDRYIILLVEAAALYEWESKLICGEIARLED